MKSMSRAFALVTLMQALALPAVAGQQDFILVNETGFTIDQLYISPVSTDEWEEDVFGDKALPDGGEVNVNFPVDSGNCNWDLKAVDEDEESAIWTDLNLCDISRITLFMEDGEPKAGLE